MGGEVGRLRLFSQKSFQIIIFFYKYIVENGFDNFLYDAKFIIYEP